MKEERRLLSPSIFTVSYKDMIDIWVETMHPEDNLDRDWETQAFGFSLQSNPYP